MIFHGFFPWVFPRFFMILHDFSMTFDIYDISSRPKLDNSGSSKATEPELVPELLRVLEKYPMAPAVLVREPWRF